MKRDSVAVPVLVTLVLALWSCPAAADPIPITDGSLQMTRSTGTLSLSGTRGFTLSASVSPFDEVFQPSETCWSAPVCVPGAVIDLGGFWVGSCL